MKKTLVVCIVVLGLALAASAGDPAIVSVDIPRAKVLALDAIRAKHPDAVPSALQFAGLTANVSTNDQIVVTVNYLVSDSGRTENVATNGYDMAKTKQTTYVVQMDDRGQTKDVSTGSSISVRSSSRKSAANQPSDRTR